MKQRTECWPSIKKTGIRLIGLEILRERQQALLSVSVTNEVYLLPTWENIFHISKLSGNGKRDKSCLFEHYGLPPIFHTNVEPTATHLNFELMKRIKASAVPKIIPDKRETEMVSFWARITDFLLRQSFSGKRMLLESDNGCWREFQISLVIFQVRSHFFFWRVIRKFGGFIRSFLSRLHALDL